MARVEKQDGELASKKYGLVWDSEREPEQVVLDCEHNLPILKRVKEVREPKGNGLEDNILIEGDNYHALTVLNYTHPESVDVIYIDPPYNTGNQDFKYNDKFVDKEDGFRHSKWLNFMEKRLNLAKDLLKNTGVIFISIDDNEQAQLKMLCDKVFGQDNFINHITVKSSENSGVKMSHTQKKLPKIKEYVLVYAKDGYSVSFNQLKVSKSGDIEKFKKYAKYYSKIIENYDEKPESWKISSISTYLKENKIKISSVDDLLKFKLDNAERIIYRTNNKTLSKLKFKTKIAAVLSPTGLEYIWWEGKQMLFLSDYTEEGICDLWADISTINLNKEMAGLPPFSNGQKPLQLVHRILSLQPNKSALVLDFFAGSGTTGHAVLELNKEEKDLLKQKLSDDEITKKEYEEQINQVGNRTFILCTNNELNGLEKELREKGISEKEIQEYGICRRVTYPRLQKVIKGYKKNGDGEKVEGLGGNLQYFKTDLLKQTKNKVQTRIDLTQKCTEMLCVKENIFNVVAESEDYKIFSSNSGDAFLCVYYNYLEHSFDDFLRALKKLKGKKVVYMFSVSDEVDDLLFADVADCVVKTIPQKILDVYKKLVKMNIPMKADTIFLEFEKAHKAVFEADEKDEGARLLRIVLEKTIKKIAQKNGISIYVDSRKEEKIATLNDLLKKDNIFSKVQWEENKTYLTIGNHAAHGDYGEYTIKLVENFYRHIQSLFNDFGI